LYGIVNGMTLEQGARAGSLLGSLKVAEAGPQSIDIDLAEFPRRFEREFGRALE
jgi:sugar/nucleoside kinase (ribokinase family)